MDEGELCRVRMSITGPRVIVRVDRSRLGHLLGAAGRKEGGGARVSVQLRQVKAAAGV